MPNHHMRHVRPVRPWNQGRDGALNAVRIGLISPAEPARKACHMGVDRDARNSERIAEHHICSLATDSGKGDKVLHPIRDLTPEPITQTLR